MESSDQHAERNVALMADSRDQASSQVHSDKTIFSPDEVISDRYRVVRFIARGGMGEVYEVEDWELRARIALKTVAPERASSPKQISRFRHEIQLARRVSHPNVCRVYDLGRQKQDSGSDVLFLTMELLTGQTLHDYINQHGPLTSEEALPIVRQMVSALAAAHQLGIVHRDFKPANVMLEETPQGLLAKVTDFGLATAPESEETVSRSLQVLGTPEYMAPEQFRGQCSSQTDIYAMGITCYQMLTGKLPPSHETPFKGGSQSGTGKRVPQRWRDAITKCLASNPADRFATVEEFWRALSGERLVTGFIGWQALAGSMRRHRLLYSLGTCAVVALLALMMTGVVPNPFRRLPQQKHIAVLPFQNIGNDASNQAFAEGVAETLTSKLSQLERYQKSFWVVPASDTRNIKSLNEAYRDLNVTLAVTGSVEQTTDGLNLTANLVDAKNHRQLASRSMHVESDNLGDLQQRVWESVADMLDLQVSQQMKDELAAGGTNQAHAYELYERGVGYLKAADLESTNRAIGLFSEALVRDSQYALAYAGLGEAYAAKYFLTKDPQWITEATRNAGRAVELNDRLVPVRASLARVYQETGQLDKALAEYQRVLEQDPSIIEAQCRLGQIYQAQGKYSEAETAYKSAIARRPTYWQAYGNLGALYYALGQFAKAAEQFQAMIDLAPDETVGYYNLGGTYLALGRYQDAINVLKRGLDIAANANAWTNLGAAYMYVGKYEDASAAMKQATEMLPHDHVLWRNLGDSYAQIPSHQADARAAYEKALETATAQLKVNPNDPVVLSGIALYYAHLGRSKDAESFIARALKVSPKDSDTLFTSALVYELLGHRDEALKAVDQAVTAGFSIDEVEKEPELRGLQSDPRYRRWLQERKSQGNTRATRIQQEDKDVLQACSTSLSLAVADAVAVLVGPMG
jgi:serine/threonine protein kinase/Flp pilus assembly protein TadD